jgi:hypothetical protein
MAYLKPVVAETSPNLYSAAKSANLNSVEVNQINQMSSAIKKHRELVKMDSDAAQRTFDRLDSKAQDQLKFLFKDSDYAKDPESATDRVKGIFTTGLKIAASPLIGLFKLGGQYNRLLNTPYKVARQVAQGEDLFSGKTWTDAWGDRWLQNYATSLIKKQWGSNLTKFTGMNLPGGVQFNGEKIYNDAVDEITKMEQEMISGYSLPVLDMIG